MSFPPQEAPRRPPSGPKRPRRGPQEAPRGPKKAPRGPKTAPQRPPNCLQEARERLPERSQRTSARPMTHDPSTVAGWAEAHSIPALCIHIPRGRCARLGFIVRQGSATTAWVYQCTSANATRMIYANWHCPGLPAWTLTSNLFASESLASGPRPDGGNRTSPRPKPAGPRTMGGDQTS